MPSSEYPDFLVRQLGKAARVRAMFGGYTLYYDEKVVGLVSDEVLFIKITPGTKRILGESETGPPYPGARDAYVIGEGISADKNALLKIVKACANDVKTKTRKVKKK